MGADAGESPGKPGYSLLMARDQIDPINDYFEQIYVHKPDWNNCYKLLVKKLFDPFL